MMRYLSAKPSSGPEKVLFWLLWVLRTSIVAGIFWMLWLGNWEAFFINIIALTLSFAPDIVSYRYKLKLPIDYAFFTVLFIYLSMFLGSAFEAYERFFWWDAMLHFASGIVLSYAAFLVLYVLFRREKMHASPFIIAVFSFSFGLALGGVWEIFEFATDSIFGTNMQRNGLQDTMWDLIVDAIGSLIVAWDGYVIIKYNHENGILYHAINRYMRTNGRK